MRFFLFLLIFSNFMAFSDVTELSILWLKSGVAVDKAELFWRDQNFAEALKLYDETLVSLNKISDSKQEFYPEIVEATRKRLLQRRTICESLVKPLDNLSETQLKEVIQSQRYLLSKSVNSQTDFSAIDPENSRFYMKLKSLRDQVADLKVRLRECENRELDQDVLQKQRQSLEAETAGCMVVAHNMLSEYQTYTKDFQEVKQRLKVVSLKNQELVKKLEVSENVELLKKLKKDVELMQVESAKVVAERDALKGKYEVALNLLKGDDGGGNTEEEYYLGLAKIEIKRLNAMLDVLQISNMELRKKNAVLVEENEKIVAVEPQKAEGGNLRLANLLKENAKLLRQVEELKSDIDYLKGLVNKESLDLAIKVGKGNAGEFGGFKEEIQILREKLLREKSLNRILMGSNGESATELTGLLQKYFPNIVK